MISFINIYPILMPLQDKLKIHAPPQFVCLSPAPQYDDIWMYDMGPWEVIRFR